MSEPPRLSERALERARNAALPGYDRRELIPGVVHFGPGAFHRAHQAVYLDDLLATDRRWAISAVALNSTETADALRPQNGLYTLALLDEEPRYRVVGSVVELLTRLDRDRITARIAAPTTLLVTATVTEKGYCLAPDGSLDLSHPSIARDLSTSGHPMSFIGRLVAGLAHRREVAGTGLTAMSCDNLADNGRKLGDAVLAFARVRDPRLADWIAAEVRFPSTMVDSITPATDDALRSQVAEATGLADAWPVQRERFSQWVIEDDFARERPPLDRVGASFVGSVRPWEQAKLRLLNGAHSTLAYLGLLLGHETVADAMAHQELAAFVERLMRDDIAPTLQPAPGLDLRAYVTNTLARFASPGIRHLLRQIASDGSQKLPFRLLGTIADRLNANASIERLTLPFAAWFRFLAVSPGPVMDPTADRLVPLARSGDPIRMLEQSGVVAPDLATNTSFRRAFEVAWRATGNPASILSIAA